MKTHLIKLMSTITFLLNFALMFGQSGSPENLQIKLMKMEANYYIFLTDTSSNPYSIKDITGDGKITGQDGKKNDVTLASFGETSFLISGINDDFKTLKLTFHQKNSKQNEYIYATFSGKNVNENAYVCPMHPKEILSKSGMCPKCGMGLAAKKVTVYKPSEVIHKGDANR